MRSFTRLACGVAVVMALSGCTGERAGEEGPGPEPEGASPSGSAEPGSEVTGSAAAGDGSQLSAEQLESVLAAVDEAEALNAQVISDAELRALEEERSAEEIDVTPEECNIYAESTPEDRAAQTTGAAMTFAGNSSLQPDSVTLASLPSEEAARAEVEGIRGQLDVCTEYTIVVSGREITTTVSQVGVDTAADADFALRTTAQIPGTIQESLTVRAVVGSTVVDVLVGGSADPNADISRAERLADLIVAELRLL